MRQLGKRMCVRDRKSGFTLVEISVVLLIIGLLISGIVVGRHLINAAELRALASMTERFNTAGNTFKIKYNCLPGDCGAAVTLGITTRNNECPGDYGNSGINGNGDGIISSNTLTGSGFCEAANVYEHLKGTNLMSEVETRLLCNGWMAVYSPSLQLGLKANSTMYVTATFENGSGQYNVNAHWLVFRDGNPYRGDCSSGYGPLSPVTAQALDRKMDDGRPLSGVVKATNQGPLQIQVQDSNPLDAYCAVQATNQYCDGYTGGCFAVQNRPYCSLQIKMAF